MPKIGMTALIPPELIFACGGEPFDVNNVIPTSKKHPRNKLCAWTAIWNEMLVNKEIKIDSLIVVAGGDCHNALVDGQKVQRAGIPTHFFFYPFDGNPEYLESQLESLTGFLGGVRYPKKFREIRELKKLGKTIDEKRCDGRISPADAFRILISFSDLCGDLNKMKEAITSVNEQKTGYNRPGSGVTRRDKSRIALIGVPPIYPDFHEVAAKLGLQVVFDELPYEFIRHCGDDIHSLARDYCEYTFARPLDFRFDFLKKELERRKVDGVIHYTQFACHHMLEDELLRKELDYPVLTIQGDMPGKTPEQVKLRLEAFGEMLGRRP